jgi:hypothetical protein
VLATLLKPYRWHLRMVLMVSGLMGIYVQGRQYGVGSTFQAQLAEDLADFFDRPALQVMIGKAKNTGWYRVEFDDVVFINGAVRTHLLKVVVSHTWNRPFGIRTVAKITEESGGAIFFKHILPLSISSLWRNRNPDYDPSRWSIEWHNVPLQKVTAWLPPVLGLNYQGPGTINGKLLLGRKYPYRQSDLRGKILVQMTDLDLAGQMLQPLEALFNVVGPNVQLAKPLRFAAENMPAIDVTGLIDFSEEILSAQMSSSQDSLLYQALRRVLSCPEHLSLSLVLGTHNTCKEL